MNSPKYYSFIEKWSLEEENKWYENKKYLSSKAFDIEFKFIKTRARINDGILTNFPNSNTITELNSIKALEKVFDALEKSKREAKKIKYTEIEGYTVLYFNVPNYRFEKFLQYDENGNFFKRMIYTG